jgi:hypothetical protein
MTRRQHEHPGKHPAGKHPASKHNTVRSGA